MIKIEKVTTTGWEPAIRGMRNSMNSWDKSDSKWLPNSDIMPLQYSEFITGKKVQKPEISDKINEKTE